MFEIDKHIFDTWCFEDLQYDKVVLEIFLLDSEKLITVLWIFKLL